jgi:hypothetical protein
MVHLMAQSFLQALGGLGMFAAFFVLVFGLGWLGAQFLQWLSESHSDT